MTPTDNIYEIFLKDIDDEMFAFLRPEIARRQLHLYLLGAIVKFKKCKKNLEIKNYYCDKVSLGMGEDLFKIPVERIHRIEAIGIESGNEYKEGTDWKVKDGEKENEFVIELELPASENIEFSFYDNGYFEDDLTYEEMYILAQGMVIYWLNPKVNREENLKQMVTDSDYKKLSGANMLDKMIKLYEKSLREFRMCMIEYTYNDFAGFN